MFALFKNLCWICSYILSCISDIRCLYFSFMMNISRNLSVVLVFLMTTISFHVILLLTYLLQIACSMFVVFFFPVFTGKFVYLHLLWLLMHLNLFLHSVSYISVPYCFFFSLLPFKNTDRAFLIFFFYSIFFNCTGKLEQIQILTSFWTTQVLLPSHHPLQTYILFLSSILIISFKKNLQIRYSCNCYCI